MISIETLQKPPWVVEEEEVKPKVLTREEFETLTINRIQGVIDYINKKFRLAPHYNTCLYEIEGGKNVYETEDDNDNTLNIEAELGQEAVLKVMKSFGLDKPKGDMFDQVKTIHDFNNTFREELTYPSSTIKGLAFIRSRFYCEDGKTVAFSWSARPQVSSVKFNPF